MALWGRFGSGRGRGKVVMNEISRLNQLLQSRPELLLAEDKTELLNLLHEKLDDVGGRQGWNSVLSLEEITRMLALERES